MVERYGRLDFAHNNAGIGVHAPLADTTDEDFDRVIAINLRGTFLGMKFQIKAMLENELPNRGAIVNTSSNAGLRAVHLHRRLHRVQARHRRADQAGRGRVRQRRHPRQRRLPRRRS